MAGWEMVQGFVNPDGMMGWLLSRMHQPPAAASRKRSILIWAGDGWPEQASRAGKSLGGFHLSS